MGGVHWTGVRHLTKQRMIPCINCIVSSFQKSLSGNVTFKIVPQPSGNIHKERSENGTHKEVFDITGSKEITGSLQLFFFFIEKAGLFQGKTC